MKKNQGLFRLEVKIAMLHLLAGYPELARKALRRASRHATGKDFHLVMSVLKDIKKHLAERNR